MQQEYLDILREVKTKLEADDYDFRYEESNYKAEFLLNNKGEDYTITFTEDLLDRWSAYDAIFSNDTAKQIYSYIVSRWAARNFEPKSNSQEEVYLTAGDLKQMLRNIPDDTPVYYERIHDVYFEENGWSFEDQQKQGTQLTIKVKQPQHGSTTEHVRAFSTTCVDGKLLITAHY